MSLIAAPPLPDSSLCISDLKSRSRDSALAEIVGRLDGVRDPLLLRETLIRRERYAGTEIGRDAALPNARSLAVCSPRCVLARSSKGLVWTSDDHPPVHLVCAVVTPAEWTEEMHHELLARMAAPLRLQRSRQKLIDAPDGPALLARWKDLVA
jgi:mannitol/fructose-specific phosphotransferase system IIA component (Ntr-type)